MSNYAYDAVSSQIVEMMEGGGVPWQKPWIIEGMRGQRNAISQRPYSGINALVLSMRAASLGVQSPYWLTAKKGFEMGLSLPKGSKSIKVLGWFSGRSKNEETGEIEENGLFAKAYSVFNFDQFTIPNEVKVPSHLLARAVVVGPSFPLIEKAEEIVLKSGAVVRHGYDAAFYIPMRDEIYLPSPGMFCGVQEYYSTLFHELVHWTGHETRLSRFKKEEVRAFRSQEYSCEELTAELGSAFICSRLGISSESSLRNSAAYLKGWLKYIKDDSRGFVYACQRASKASDYVFELAMAESQYEPVMAV